MGLTLLHLFPSAQDESMQQRLSAETIDFFRRGIRLGRVLFVATVAAHVALFYWLYGALTSLSHNYFVATGAWWVLFGLWLWKAFLGVEWSHGRLLDKIPNGPRFPLIGHLYMVLLMNQREVLELMARQAKEMTTGLIPVFFVGFQPAVLITDPDAIREVLTTDFQDVPKNEAIKFFYPWLGKGLLTSGGNHWKVHRRLLTPAFHFGALQRYFEIESKHVKLFASIVGNLAEKRSSTGSSGVPFDIAPLISFFTLDIISESAFGYVANSQNIGNSEYVAAVKTCCETVGFHAMQRPFIPEFFWHNFMPSGRRFLKARDVCHGISGAIIEKRREERKYQKEDPNRAPADFLDILLAARDEEGNGEGLSDQDIMDEVNTFIFEGFDTTATALTWLIYEIASHPAVEARLVAELEEVMGDRSFPVYEDLKKFKYLEMCAKESLRLHPSVYLFGRYTLKDIHVGEYVIPKNTELAVITYVVHRLPQFWESPDVYDPERFSPERQAKQHPFQFIPFSAGSRNCIGQKLAMDEIRTAIATLYKEFHFDVVAPEDVIPEPSVVLRAEKGLKVIATRRSQMDASSSTVSLSNPPASSAASFASASSSSSAAAAVVANSMPPPSRPPPPRELVIQTTPWKANGIAPAPLSGAGAIMTPRSLPFLSSPASSVASAPPLRRPFTPYLTPGGTYRSAIVETSQPNTPELRRHRQRQEGGVVRGVANAALNAGVVYATFELGRQLVL